MCWHVMVPVLALLAVGHAHGERAAAPVSSRAPYKARSVGAVAAAAAAAPDGRDGDGAAAGAPAPASRRLQGHWAECGTDWHFVVGEDDDVEAGSHVGSMTNPIVLLPDCPVTVEVARGSHAFLAMQGFSEVDANGNRPQLRFAWEVDDAHDETPLTAFSFRGLWPRFEGAAANTFFDWYYWPLLLEDEIDFVEHPDGYDYYHCYGGCDYYDAKEGVRGACGKCDPDVDLREASDLLLVAVSAYANKGPMTATYTASLFANNAAIHADDLAAVKELYAGNCEPWSDLPAGWNWDAWQIEGGPGARGERDSRHKPYCDWWPAMDSASLGAVPCWNQPLV